MIRLLPILMLGQVVIMKDDVPVARETKNLNFSGSPITCAPYKNTVKCTVTSGGGGGSGGSGAPVDGGYVTFSGGTTGSTNERTLTAGTNIAISTATPGQVSIGVTGAVASATALASNPTDCASGFAYAIDASGNLTCSIADPTVGGTGLTTIDVNQIAVGTAADTMTAKTLPSCSNATTSKLLYDDTTQTFSCGTDQTGGGKSVEASITLSGGSGYFSTSVSYASTGATDKFSCRPFGTTADGLTPEAIAVAGLQATVSDLSAGVGFTLHVFSPYGLEGTVRFHCTTGG